MVAMLMHLCGLYLGEKRDLMPASQENPDGFWENTKFVRLNDVILHELGGGWDYPPAVRGKWEPVFSRLRGSAEQVLQEFADHSPWGWKDPRNSLTLPFWTRLLPQSRVVICLRNPLEVALSLRRRNYFSYSMGLALWRNYNERILESSDPALRIVTHYDAYLTNPRAEMRRVL
ncbi:MAG: sulfotransferase family protein, partial [Deltaproteobacteria bacterium]